MKEFKLRETHIKEDFYALLIALQEKEAKTLSELTHAFSDFLNSDKINNDVKEIFATNTDHEFRITKEGVTLKGSQDDFSRMLSTAIENTNTDHAVSFAKTVSDIFLELYHICIFGMMKKVGGEEFEEIIESDRKNESSNPMNYSEAFKALLSLRGYTDLLKYATDYKNQYMQAQTLRFFASMCDADLHKCDLTRFDNEVLDYDED